jgi:formylglycine-generating enzyme required for sulfatase activity
MIYGDLKKYSIILLIYSREKINMNRHVLLLSIFFLSLLISCKTITVSDESDIAEIPAEIELINIPAGSYIQGRSSTTATIDYSYSIMKFPVTNDQFLKYLKEALDLELVIVNSQSVSGFYKGDKNWSPGFYELIDFDDPDCRIGFNPPDEFVTKWRWVDGRQEGYNDHPVVEVTWFGAKAYADYYGMDLPTKEEWEKASRANTDHDFPWGDDIDSSKANFLNSGDLYDNDTTPVGFFNGKNNTIDSYSPFGIYDMCGNVWEWTNSWKDQSPGIVIKGGSWQSGSVPSGNDRKFYELYTWFEPSNGYVPISSLKDIGFRCVLK